MTTIGIVACSKAKLPRPAPACDLYTSPLFRAARTYCEATYDRWFILSAKYGLVLPYEEIEPYDVTLAGMTRAERLNWLEKVGSRSSRLRLHDVVKEGGRIYVHAGKLYREPFRPEAIVVPLEGLGIGQQLAWYAARRAEREGR